MTRSQISRRSAGALALIVIVALAACTSSGSSSASAGQSGSASASVSAEASTSASASGTAAPSPSSGAAASDGPTGSLLPFACTPTVAVAATTDRAQITDVRVGTHAGYDRVTFEFASGIPDVQIAGVLPPFYKDPSGQALAVAGTAFLKVTMHGGTKVSPSGAVTYTGSTNFSPGFGRLQQLVEGGDFEAVSTWYLGLNGGGCIRVLTLAGPSRLVIDIQH
ncbi:MAG: hypothetical protein M3R32_04495 [Chloroflexota bacterium]|nr:hypothetical protein [Chloroflexota bacterium]